jgi:hypothetical protein
MVDYAASIAVLVFAAVLWITRPRALVPFVAGGLIPLAVLIWYHTVVFGGPTITAYRSMNPRIAPGDGNLLRVPEMSTIATLTVSPYRGIFFYSPVLLLAAVGAWSARRRSQKALPAQRQSGHGDYQRVMIWTGIAIFGLWFLFNACYYIWWGGWTAGSRYIVPGLVLLAPAIAAGFAAMPRSGAVLLAISIANHLAISTVLVMVNDDVVNPLRDVIYPLLWKGEFRRSNLGVLLLNLKGLWSLAALVLPAGVLSLLLTRRIAFRP